VGSSALTCVNPSGENYELLVAIQIFPLIYDLMDKLCPNFVKYLTLVGLYYTLTTGVQTKTA